MSTTTTVLNYDTLSHLSTTIPADKPIFVLNLMRFKPIATYSPSAPASFHSLPPLSGREAYFSRYVATFQPRMPASAGPVFLGKPIKSLLAALPGIDNREEVHVDGKFGQLENDKEDRWDNVAIIKYGSLKEFRDIVENEWYRENLMHHRIASIEEYSLIICEEISLV